ncbi:MAG: glycosyltransferase [Bacteroidia bacterium]|nr:glycosyltransferase [Bacteroidia bacterium]
MFNILQLPFYLLNKLIPKVNLYVSVSRKTYFKKNVFNTNYKKHVLVSYLSNPFNSGTQNKHTNHIECKLACEVLNELNYNVDVIDYDHPSPILFKKYDLIYGFGNQFEQSFYDQDFKGKRIMYSPGCNTVYSNLVSCVRLKEYTKIGGQLNPHLVRTTNDAWPLQKYLSDAIICQGNDFVLNTYKSMDEHTNYYQINCFPLSSTQPKNTLQKDFKLAKYNLLWFGSQGSVHKGLDIALEIIEKNPKLKLYIRGLNTNHEQEIITRYQHLINNKQVNIAQYVDVNSAEFTSLMQTCGGVIFPSASEGGAAALLTVMTHGGLVPIITKACGLDIDHLGFIAEECTLYSVEEQLNKYLNTSDDDLLKLSQTIKEEINKTYNTVNYKNNIRQLFTKILS